MPDEFDINKFSAELVNSNIDRFFELGTGIFKGARARVFDLLRRTYTNYLKKASERYSKTKTFFIRDAPTPLYDFYVPLSISSGEKTFQHTSIIDIEKVTSAAVIVGTAGTGKSTLMRHLFLDCIKSKKRVPVFLELRHLNNSGQNIKELLHETLKSQGLDLEEEYITRAFEDGHFAILLDGFDELDISLRSSVAKTIQKTAQEWSRNLIVISSRPDEQFAGWDDFTVFSTLPLDIDEAVELVEKLPFDELTKSHFVNDLRKELFASHNSFLSNPLLLSIMLLTYGQSANIPQKLSVFYNQAYEALFHRHDAFKGAYQRPRKTGLDVQDFASVFAAFCVVTYDNQAFEFSRTDALEYLRKAKSISGLDFQETKYLDDLLQAVCLLLHDGLLLTFSHRSFQEHFVARFIHLARPTHQNSLVDRYKNRISSDSVIELLFEIDRELIERILIIPAIDEFAERIQFKRKVGISHYLRYLKMFYGRFMKDQTEERHMSGLLKSDFLSLHQILNFIHVKYLNVFRKAGADYSWDREKWAEFLKKHFDDENRNKIEVTPLTSRDPFVIALSKCRNHWSMQYVEALMELRNQIRQDWEQAEKSIDEILEI